MKTVHKVRALVLDSKGRVYAIRADAKHVLQLPGGSRHKSENPIKALKREILEETGFKVKVHKRLKTITVRRCGVKEVTRFYVVTIRKHTGATKLTKAECDRGLRTIRYESLDSFCEALYGRLTRYKRTAVQRDHTLATAALKAADTLLGDD